MGRRCPKPARKQEFTPRRSIGGGKEYGGLKLEQAKRLKELEKENARLKRVVAELSLEKQVLREVAQGNFGNYILATIR